MENIITLEEAKVLADKEWRDIFEGKINEDLLHYCIYSISLNDPAHHLNHVKDVCKLGRYIAEHVNLDERNKLLVYMGCLLHDIGCKYDRKEHHLIGYGLTYEIINNYWPDEFDDDEVSIIATSVIEHRSSNPNKPTSLISSIVSVSDSGVPDFDKYITRAIQFRLKKGIVSVNIVEDVYKHMLEKFGVEGYHWKSYPDVGMQFFKTEWENFSNYLYNATETLDRIKSIYHSLGGIDNGLPN